jgi:hypothetical protein
MKNISESARSRNNFLSIYHGQTRVGHIVARGKLGFEGFDINERSIGLFPSMRHAANTVEEAQQ